MSMTGCELNGTYERDFRMRRTILSMSNFAIFSINGPLILLNFMANIFFAFCLMNPKTQQMKQPLKILLGSLVFYTILYICSVILMVCVTEWVISNEILDISYTVLEFMMRGNRTSYVWLMFYYYIMIVPSKRALFIWVKKNIKSIIYVVMFFQSLMFLGDASFHVAIILESSTHCNSTTFVDVHSSIVMFSIVNVYIYLCLCIMIISCFATAHYLNKHKRSLAASGGSLISPRLHSQIRVTVTGFLQGVLCLLYAIWNLVTVISFFFSPYFFIDSFVTLTVINLYISGTTINLWIGQSLFRERAVHVWKAVKKRLGTGKSSKNLRPVDTDM